MIAAKEKAAKEKAAREAEPAKAEEKKAAEKKAAKAEAAEKEAEAEKVNADMEEEVEKVTANEKSEKAARKARGEPEPMQGMFTRPGMLGREVKMIAAKAKAAKAAKAEAAEPAKEAEAAREAEEKKAAKEAAVIILRAKQNELNKVREEIIKIYKSTGPKENLDRKTFLQKEQDRISTQVMLMLKKNIRTAKLETISIKEKFNLLKANWKNGPNKIHAHLQFKKEKSALKKNYETAKKVVVKLETKLKNLHGLQ
jgi:cell wall-associated NlpC family hydrolase